MQLLGLDTAKAQSASTSAAMVAEQPQAQEGGRQASAQPGPDAITWQVFCLLLAS
jgi:hypothetical protein